MLAQCSQ